MERKKINFLRHLAVLSLTIVIFVTGIFIGDQVDDLRVNSMYLKLQEQDLDFQNILTEKTYIEYLVSQKEEGKNNLSCQFLKTSYISSMKYLDQSRIKLEKYTQNANDRKEQDFLILKEYYSNIQINYWLLSNRISNLCESNIKSILYFYGKKESCPECYDQGIHLDYVKQVLQDDIMIFVFDRETGNGPINLLANSYNISKSSLPKIVIENKVYGFSTNKEIFKKLCGSDLNNESCKTNWGKK